MAGGDQGAAAVEVDALQDQGLPQGTALLRVAGIEALPGDIVHRLVIAIMWRGVGAVVQFPIAMFAVDSQATFSRARISFMP